MNKKNERRQKILEYLKQKETVTSKELLEILEISKSTLSTDLDALIKDGHPIDNTKYGYVSLNVVPKTGDILDVTDNLDFHEDLSKATIRKWLILYVINYIANINGAPVSSEIIRKYLEIMYKLIGGEEMAKQISEYMFNKDLRDLCQNNYLTVYRESLVSPNMFTPTGKAPKMVIINHRNAQEIDRIISADPDIFSYHSLKTKLNVLFPDIKIGDAPNEFVDDYLTAVKHIGNFIQHHYDTNCLDITCKTGNTSKIYKNFATFLIVYSAEKNRFFIWGEYNKKNKTRTNRECISLRADTIISIQDTDEKNEIFLNEADLDYGSFDYDLYEKYNQSFEGIYENKAYEVNILFTNSPQNKRRLSILKNERCVEDTDRSLDEYSAEDLLTPEECGIDFDVEKITIDTSNGILQYKDTIRGLMDFQRFIRGFGNEVQVIEPKKLANNIKESRQLWKKRYQDIFLNEYGEELQNK